MKSKDLKLTNLEKVIEELNSSKEYEFEGEKELLESPYRFVIRFEKTEENEDRIVIFDENEHFNIDLDEEICALTYQCAQEFGFEYKTPDSTIEEIKGKFADALEKDLGHKVFLEWYDSVVMWVCEA